MAQAEPFHVGTVVMAHPARSLPALKVAKAAGPTVEVIFDPDPEGPPSALRTAAIAWRRCRPGQTHHLVLQDDIQLSARFEQDSMDAVKQVPDRALALYSNSNSWNGALARVAVMAGYSWIEPSLHEYFPAPAVLMPCGLAHDFCELAATRVPHGDFCDDILISRFFASIGHQPRLRVPNLVQHTGLPSLSDNDRQGIRRSVCFQGDHPHVGNLNVLKTPSVWPVFRKRRAYLGTPVALGNPSGGILAHDSHLRMVRLSPDRLDALAIESLPLLSRLPERTPNALRFVRELCLACYSLGWAVGEVSPGIEGQRSALKDDALRSLIEAGIFYESMLQRWIDQFDNLIGIAWKSFDIGLARFVESVNPSAGRGDH